MESRASYVLVGLFVVGLLAGAATFLIWLIGDEPVTETDQYRVHFSGSVTGLEAGARVRYRGIPVGRVTRIGFHPEDTGIIEVYIEVIRRTPITTATRARMEVQGLAGQPFIQLVEGQLPEGESALRLLPTEADPAPVIQGEPSQLDQIFEEVPRAVRAITSLTGELQDMLRENRPEIETLLSNSTTAMNEIGTLARELQPLARDLQPLARELEPLARDVRSVVPEARNALQAFASTNQQLQQLLRENRRPINDFTQTGLYELVQFMTETRQFLRTSTRILRRLESDPSQFLFGNQQQGYRPQ